MVVGRYIDGGIIKPGIFVWDKEKNTAKLIEVTVPNDYGLKAGDRKKVTKYQDLKTAFAILGS